MACKNIITISRQFGSGGREIGEALSAELGIKCYDKELISIAAKESGIDADVFNNVDEKATNSLLYSLSMGLYSFSSNYSSGQLPVNDRLYLLQHKIIKNLANEEPCIFVGRCADYILGDRNDVVKVFIYADMDYRIKRAVEVKGVDSSKAEHVVAKTDKSRANYYNFYSGKKWGLAENYDLCINRTKLSTEQVVKVISDYINTIN
ncbi:MAG: cytidylate kinase-like family protein [Ruminococcus sp.]|jgi:cytidylate kinase|nr:cytidylate kinase-like family protein [Ruminococcus sp.]